jgi:hypothetical protein
MVKISKLAKSEFKFLNNNYVKIKYFMHKMKLRKCGATDRLSVVWSLFSILVANLPYRSTPEETGMTVIASVGIRFVHRPRI